MRSLRSELERLSLTSKKEIEENGVNSTFADRLQLEVDDLESQCARVPSISLVEHENTVESYYSVVEDNPNGIFFEFNEWGKTFDDLEGENKRLRQFLMDGWDGKNKFSYKTKHNGNNLIKELNLSVGFSVQESVISHIFWKFMNVSKSNDGLMQRFMLILSDGKHRPPRDVSFTMPAAVTDIFRNAYNIKRQEEPVTLTVDAYDFWMDWLCENQNFRINTKNSTFSSFYSKHDGLIIRLAANLAHLKNDGRRIQQIDLSDMVKAREICLYLRDNFKSICDLSEHSALHEIVEMIEMGVVQDLTPMKDLPGGHNGIFKDIKRTQGRMKVLEDHGYVRVCRDKRGKYIKVNPKLRSAT